MTVQVVKLMRYVVKGTRGESRNSVGFSPTIGIVMDRRYGLKRKADMPDTWQPKGKFSVCMNTPALATFEPEYDSLGIYSLTEATKAKLAEMLGGSVDLLDTRGNFNLTDTNSSAISILNLASVRSLSAFVGEEIDPARFRMNVWIDGLDPFEELSWVTSYPGAKIITIGEHQFRVHDACERCKAIEASPRTGTHDIPLLDRLEVLMKLRGYPGSPHRGVHRVMGIMAEPLSYGRLSVGNTVIA